VLKPGEHDPLKRHGLFGRFNRWLDRQTGAYLGVVRRVVGRRVLHMGVFAAITLAMVLLFLRLPTGFLPNEDQGEAMVLISLPAGATAQRTDAVIDQVQKYYLTAEKKRWPARWRCAASASTGRGRTRAWALWGWCRLTSARARKARSMPSTCAR
jgi:multidrug efflux pump